jgi:hypothetical protein
VTSHHLVLVHTGTLSTLVADGRVQNFGRYLSVGALNVFGAGRFGPSTFH